MSPEFELPEGELKRETGRVGFVGQSQISCNSFVYVALQTQSCLRYRKTNIHVFSEVCQMTERWQS